MKKWLVHTSTSRWIKIFKMFITSSTNHHINLHSFFVFLLPVYHNRRSFFAHHAHDERPQSALNVQLSALRGAVRCAFFKKLKGQDGQNKSTINQKLKNERRIL